jgi:hypothetical protein
MASASDPDRVFEENQWRSESAGATAMIAISKTPKPDSVEQIVERAKLIRTASLAKGPSRAYVATLVSGLIGACTLLVMFGAEPERQRALEATTRMERLATRLGHVHSIAPETAREIARLLGQPQYSCTRMACGDALDARNRKARIKLKMLLGMASASGPAGSD